MLPGLQTERRIYLLGLGYVGLPTAGLLASAGHSVHGVDVAPEVVTRVLAPTRRFKEPGLEPLVAAEFASGRLSVGSAPTPADLFVLCVPTPFDEDNHPDVSHLLAALDAVVLSGAQVLIDRLRPAVVLVLVHGDTTTAAEAALAAFYAGVPIGHVEAGLRTGSLSSPWGEGAHRSLIARVATWHFSPTERASDALLKEGIAPTSVTVVGDTGVDALRWIRSQPLRPSPAVDARQPAGKNLPHDGDNEPPLVLVTIHRRESLPEGLKRVCRALRMIAATPPSVMIIFPVHPGPDVERVAHAELSGASRVHLTMPLCHATFLRLLRLCRVALTDSGGVQEEALCSGKPALVLREVTDRPESVAPSVALLVGTHPECIASECSRLLSDADHHASMSPALSLFGDGRAADRIVQVPAEALGARG
jgi:UDP-N-acetylglucosamine 2-epimerase